MAIKSAPQTMPYIDTGGYHTCPVYCNARFAIILSNCQLLIQFGKFKGAIIFYREGGPSVCDRGSPIFSGPPLGMRKKFIIRNCGEGAKI